MPSTMTGADHRDHGVAGRLADLHGEVAVALVDQRLLGVRELARQCLERVRELRFLLELLDLLGIDLIGHEETGEQARQRLDLGPTAEPGCGSLERDLDAAIGEDELGALLAGALDRGHHLGAGLDAELARDPSLERRHDQRAEEEDAPCPRAAPRGCRACATPPGW